MLDVFDYHEQHYQSPCTINQLNVGEQRLCKCSGDVQSSDIVLIGFGICADATSRAEQPRQGHLVFL